MWARAREQATAIPGRRWLSAGVLPGAAAAVFFAAVAAAGPFARGVTTYAASSSVALVATLASAAVLLAAAGLAGWNGSTRRVGVLLLVAGTAWVAPLWVGWSDGAPVVRSLGMLLSPLTLPALVGLAVRAPGRPVSRAVRRSSLALWLATVAYTLARAAVRDPLLDLNCWSNCTDNVFLVHPDPRVARALDAAWLLVVAIVALAVVGLVAARVAGGGSRGRVHPRRDVWLWLVSVPAALALATEAAFALALLANAAENPSQPPFAGIYLARAAASTLVGLGAGAWVIRSRVLARAVARLAVELGAAPEPGALQSWLARAWRDPGVQVLFSREGSSGYLDAFGSPATPEPGPGQELLAIRRDGAPVAVVLHRPTRTGPTELATQLGPAALLAIDNERLRAEVLARLADLRASRARIVQSADRTRQQLERDLHDGAQQRLLAATYQLRLARAALGSGATADQETALDHLLGEAAVAIAELRELAHGIFPAVLDEAGLEPALQTLADQARVPTEVVVTGVAATVAAARAAYELVAAVLAASEALDPADEDANRPVRVGVDGGEGVLRVDVSGAATVDYLRCADRIGALGGWLTLEGQRLRAEIPCG